MNKPSNKVWNVIKGDKISEKNYKKLHTSSFIEELNKAQWSKETLPQNITREDPDFEAVWDKIQSEVKLSTVSSYRKISLSLLKYAAILFLAALSFYAGLKIENLNVNNIAETFQINNPRGVRSEVRLPDNSRVWLNAGSSLNYDPAFGQSNRNLFLTGEAIFEVESNETLPFIVNTTGSRTVQAIGTEFFVSAYGTSKEFITGLIEGSILVKTESENVVISNPETLIFSNSNGKILERTNLKEYQLAWKNGKLIFENTRLDEIARRLSNWYNISITTEESLKNQRFTLTIEDEKPREVLDLLKLASKMDYKKNDDGYIIIDGKN